ncbi:hypothetical protein GJU94_05830 [Brucella sp. 10RB9214]|uniref:hypothetical protein n=1 Tax=unclassified Brucella TaxID=2632610 RepID=UPI00097278C8|nr:MULTISPECIES: hypothetical protein [unclassified Brucella]APY14242.1 hypothetical protein BKD02_08120 [Brucella sp. 09RB8910]MRN47990.1 hypothetical protein [Brucella sp. 10RB9212]MRN49352.1 hypothetical protein [Brucella sp. 10RB9214]UWF58518.1 hypothetical protein NYO66_08100 [Brucella sp. 2716]
MSDAAAILITGNRSFGNIVRFPQPFEASLRCAPQDEGKNTLAKWMQFVDGGRNPAVFFYIVDQEDYSVKTYRYRQGL